MDTVQLVRGNVVLNAEKQKIVIREDRPMDDSESFVCLRPHGDSDFSYMCHSDFCRCKS